ncbi:butyrophilin subfamily 1 member A1-like [Carettochelys insculpta]|uniref:butyrophilin subfamily 1 member A1-like n=1 Tax=Carettochelys insculpta TaxID=44489 RepID=UPI003EBA3F59
MKMRIRHHSHCAMDNLLLSSYIIFFFTLHVAELESVTFKVIGPEHPIVVSAGEDALLSCQLSPSMSAQEMEVRWLHSKNSELVHLYQHGEDQADRQSPKYQGRTGLLKDGMLDGKVALHIHNITPFDQGQFICFFQSPNFYGQATLELKVTGLGSTPRISMDNFQRGGIHMVCESSGWYPAPRVQWRDLTGQHLPSLMEKITQRDNGLFEAQISIIVTSSQELSCCVRNSDLNQGKESTVYISDPLFPSANPWKVAVFMLLVASGLLTFTASYFFWKQHKAKGKLVADIVAHLAENAKLQNELGLRRAQMYQASVILDPTTAHRELLLSEDRKCATKGDIAQNVPDKPERFDSSVCVLGAEGFTSGLHYWEVEVANGGDWWAVGVASESVRRKGWLNFSPAEKIWAVECDWGKYQALDFPITHLPLNERPGKIGVFLNTEERCVAFYDTDNLVPIYTFRDVSFPDEKILPFFCVWRTPGKCVRLWTPHPEPEQVRGKVKELQQDYAQVSLSGAGLTTCPCYQELRSLLGPRDSSPPPATFNTAVGELRQEAEEVLGPRGSPTLWASTRDHPVRAAPAPAGQALPQPQPEPEPPRGASQAAPRRRLQRSPEPPPRHRAPPVAIATAALTEHARSGREPSRGPPAVR